MEWRQIDGWPHEVSECGDVRRTQAGHCTFAGRIIKPDINEHGYHRVALCHCGIILRVGSHVLVCTIFNGPKPTPLHMVAHGDGDPGRNHFSNLRWATSLENCADTIRHGRSLRGEKNAIAKLTDAQAEEIRAIYDAGLSSQWGLAHRFGVSQAVVSKIVRREKYLPHQRAA